MQLSFITKLTKNEKHTLILLINDPLITNSNIAKKLKITAQGVGKIRKQLYEKGIIKNHELSLDYERLGIGMLAITMLKILPSVFKKFKNNELDKVLKHMNVIRSYALPETDITHMILYAFRDIKEYDEYFRSILEKFGDFVEIKYTFVFSSRSKIKSSSKEIFLDVLEKMEI